MKITIEQILKFHAKAARETTHSIKPIVTKDKKKEFNKKVCRKFKNNEEF